MGNRQLNFREISQIRSSTKLDLSLVLLAFEKFKKLAG